MMAEVVLSAQLISQTLLMAGTGADLASTAIAMRHYGGTEANPMNARSPKGQVVFAGLTTALVEGAAQGLKQQGHPKAAIWLRVVVGGVHFAAAGWNVRGMMRGTKR